MHLAVLYRFSALDICLERMDAEAPRPPRIETAVETAVDNCPERMDAVDAEGPVPPRIETAVQF